MARHRRVRGKPPPLVDLLKADARQRFNTATASKVYAKLFSESRKKWGERFARGIRKKGPKFHDKGVRRIYEKVSRTGFAFIISDCHGHPRDFKTGHKIGNLNQVKPGQELYFGGAHLNLILNNGQKAARFRDVIFETFNQGNFEGKVLIAPIVADGLFNLHLTYMPTGIGSTKPTTKKGIAMQARQNQAFLDMFEIIVDIFLAGKRRAK